jgi:hypothetical protein
LKEHYNLAESQIGPFFMIVATTYMIGSVVTTQLSTDAVQKRTWIILGLFCGFISNLFVGPSEFFNFP